VPEGDNIWQTARRLDALTGHELTRTDFRIPSLATADLSGRRVLETVSRGKHLLTRVEGDATIHSHLKMEGRWDVQPAGSRWRRPAHEARVVLGTEAHEAIGFSVVLDLVATTEEDRVVGHLGPDLLGPDWDEAEAVRRLEQSPDAPIGIALLDQRNLAGAGARFSTGDLATRTIGETLLDQRCLAGIGNVYKAEVLFLAGVWPFTPVPDVPDLPKVVSLARRLLVANRDRPVRVTTGVNRRGQELWVYGRARQPCRRCGTPIAMERQGEPGQDRVTYWCPSCQPKPSSCFGVR
jgi:endonuclease-8